MKFTLNILGNNRDRSDRRAPSYLFGGRLRTSTLAFIMAFLALWWVYDTYRPEPHQPPPVQVVPPGFVPDPNYTWVPRNRVDQQQPPASTVPTTPTTGETTMVPTPTTTAPTPPCLLPHPFCPGDTSSPSSPAQLPQPGPGPAPTSASPAS